MSRHFLTLLDMERGEPLAVLDRAADLKAGRVEPRGMENRLAVLLFEKASTRTRVSFEAGVRRLGGQSLLMTPAESQLGRHEPLKDTARVLSRYAHCLVVRTFSHAVLDELAKWGTIPVVNALCDDYHPCQLLADVLTMRERTPDLKSLKVAWIGDGNNMAHSWLNAAAVFGFELTLAVPEGYDPKEEIVREAERRGARFSITRDPAEAAVDADYVNTDVWASMGEEHEQAERERAFSGFQVNAELLAKAKPGCKVLHCLPAHRGEEITDEVMEGPASIVFDQAENRLHAQMALLQWIFDEL